ncbi:GPI-anchored protein PB15E9.01c, partial [Biomphalaria pfeifferi]
QMDKPVIVTDSGSSNQVMFGRYFTLYCNRASGPATFEWYLGATKLNATTDTYSTVASASNVGSF